MAPRVDMAVGKCQKWGLLLGRMRHAVAVGLYWAKVRATGEIIIVIKNHFFVDISLHQNGSWPLNYSIWCLGLLLPTCSCLKAPNPTQTNAAIMLGKSRLISAEQPSFKRETTANLVRWISACGTAHWGWRSRLPKDVAE